MPTQRESAEFCIERLLLPVVGVSLLESSNKYLKQAVGRLVAGCLVVSLGGSTASCCMCLGYAPVVVATTLSFGRLSVSAAVAVIPSHGVAALSCLFGLCSNTPVPS